MQMSRSVYRDLRYCGLFVAMTAELPVAAQRTAENAVTSADDAFGSTIGNERTGLYSESDVRGFSPVKAGNLRIEGVYFDQQGGLTARLRTSSVVRVGVAALDYPLPAPSGIVDYRLRPSGDDFLASVGLARQPYGGYYGELDIQVPLVAEHLSIAAGISYYQDRYSDGAGSTFLSMAAVPRIRFSGGTIIPLFSRVEIRETDTRPIVSTDGSFVPPVVRSSAFYGQEWARGSNDNTNFGVVSKFEVAPEWTLDTGVFQSKSLKRRGFTDLFSNVQPDGSARHTILADPVQPGHSTSGEARLTWTRSSGTLRHRLHLSSRGRDKVTTAGGFAAQQLGSAIVGVPSPQPKPVFNFGTLNRSEIRQGTIGAGYIGQWVDHGQLNVGLQKTRYEASFEQRGVRTESTDTPWLYNATVAVFATDRIALYAGKARGLEESGAAPESAANRNETLPAARTTQIDGGARLSIGPARLVVGAFDIRKPYFSFDTANVFTELGTVRHRGIEASLAGELVPGLNVLGGLVKMRPRVTGPARVLGRVGRKPVGTTDTVARLDLDYRIAPVDGLSVNASVLHAGRRVASSFAAVGDSQLTLPALTMIDIGARYRFQIGDTPLTARILVSNISDERSWRLVASNTYQAGETRRVALYLAADF